MYVCVPFNSGKTLEPPPPPPRPPLPPHRANRDKVFCELERVLDSELDFRAEAQAMEKIAAGVAHTVGGHRARPPIVVPRPVPGLCSGRVLVMEYVQV